MKLSTRIMAALVLGVVAGLLLGADGAEFAKTWIAPFGAIFMNMIKMTIVPMVFASLVMGMCSLGDIKSYHCRLPRLLFARCICIWRHAESYRQIQPA